jgi:hypothetical protein
MLDEIFGEENFRNEIIWNFVMGASAKRFFGRKHQVVFFYVKSDNYKFNLDEVRVPYNPETLARADRGEARYSVCGEELEKKGKNPGDVWTDINPLQGNSTENFGYPTQKPEALLERIIKASSNKDDVVADFFCGCGTTITVAQRLGRRWIGVDISPTAIKIMQRRLEQTLGMIEGVNYEVIGMPTTVEDVRKLEPFEFQNWVVIDRMRANASRKKVGDMGLDGYYPRSILTEEAGIQVKQSDGVGRNVIDNFETALKRAGYKKGYIVAFSFSSGAYEEVARIKNKGELDIKLITVEELLTKHKI